MLKGQTAELTFSEAGTFNYVCGLHPSMKGSVEVK
jgi:plastocyanin